jgi:hypothetical protein
MEAVDVVDPATHADPALQLPEHSGVARPETLPKRPAKHSPLRALEVRPLVTPYSPAAQSTHAPHPDSEYRPGGHTDAVALVDPATQKYPALQFAVQLDTDRPDTDPYRPASQGPLQVALGMAVVAPNSPALQLVQAPAPTALYVPTGHVTAVGTMDAGGHT